MNEAGGFGPEAAIADLRERGAERFDAVRFRFIEALARRTAAQEGSARPILENRLEKALAECRRRLDLTQGEDTAAGLESTAPPSPLAELLAYIGRLAAGKPEGSAEEAIEPETGSQAELKSVQLFRSTWSKLSVEQQINQALAQVPENAGPLNSHLLVLQSLKVMQDTSPEYLNRFMSYVDALLWLDLADGAGPLGQKNAPRGEWEKKRKAAGRGKGG